MEMQSKSIGIIGGGPNGIIALYECNRMNIKATVYEKQSNIGGIWNLADYGNQAHKSTILNTSTILSSLDTPYKLQDVHLSNDEANYATSNDFFNYLKGFVKINNLENSIKFGVEVNEIISKKDGSFQLKTIINGKEIICNHDYIIVCTGRFGKEIYPHELLKGHQFQTNKELVYHTRYWDILNPSSPSYKVLDSPDVKLLFVGGSVSSAEAIENTLERFQQGPNENNRKLKIYWHLTRDSNKRNIWLLDRYPHKGRKRNLPADQSGCRIYSYAPEYLFQRLVTNITVPLWRKNTNDLVQLGIDRLAVCKTQPIISAIAAGQIEFVFDQITSIEPTNQMSQIRCHTNRTTIDVDAVVLGTGYQPQDILINGTNYIKQRFHFHRYIVPCEPQLRGRIGYICTTKIFGSDFPVCQFEVRWLLHHWLFKPAALQSQIIKIYYQTTSTSQSTIPIEDVIRQPGSIMEELARDVHCIPPIFTFLFNPFSRYKRHLALAWLLGPWIIHQYENCLGESPEEIHQREQYTLWATNETFLNSRSPVSFTTLCRIWDAIYLVGCCSIVYATGKALSNPILSLKLIIYDSLNCG